jgi:hypothetical protein
MPSSSKDPSASTSEPAVDLHALYLRRLAVHEKEAQRQRETVAAQDEARVGIERLRQAGHDVPQRERAPDSPAMTALRDACIAACDADIGPSTADYTRRRLDYLRTQMAYLGEHEEALARRDQMRALLASVLGDRPEEVSTAGSADLQGLKPPAIPTTAGAVEHQPGQLAAEVAQLRSDTAQLVATNEQLRAQIRALGADPDAGT